MEDNLEQNKDSKAHVEIVTDNNEKKIDWAKYLILSLAAFFGAFLAVYFVMDSMFHRYFIPVPPPSMKIHEIDDFLEHQDKMMDDFIKYKPAINPFIASPVKVQTFQEGDEYKVIVDLKPFDGNEKNIKLDVTQNNVKISGKSEKKGKNGEEDVSFMQSFSLPHKVDVNDIKTEKKGSNYIITLPLED